MHTRSSKTHATVCALAATALAIAVATGCAASEEPPDNGQSHWLQTCDDDADCAELSCICGVCTLACESDDACASASNFSCGTGALLAVPNQCDGDPAETRLCLPAVFVPAADSAVSELDAGLDGGPSTDGGGNGGDASTDKDGGEHDTGVVEPPPLGIGPYHIECDMIEAGELPAGVELFGSSAWPFSFSGTAMIWADSNATHYRASPTAEIQTFELEMYNAVLDGPDIFFTIGKSLAKLTIDSGEIVNLGAATSGGISGPTLDESSVYWVKYGSLSTGRQQLMRSDRDPGDTVRLATTTNSALQIVDAIDEYVYLTIDDYSDASGWQLARILKDGGTLDGGVEDAGTLDDTAIEPLGEPQNIQYRVVSNGSDFLAYVSTGSGTPGMPRGDNRILRWDRTDGTLHTLFETQHVEPARLTADANYVYWIANTNFSTTKHTLWAGAIHGGGEPIVLAEGWTEQNPEITTDGTSIYMTMICGDSGGEQHVVRIGKAE